MSMSTNLLLLNAGLVLWFAAAELRADVVEMQNGDRYSGKVLSVSADSVVLDSEILGKINVPRGKVARLAFGANAPAPKAADNPAPPASTNLATVPQLATSANSDLSAAFRALGANTNFIGQIRQQMLGDNPEAAGKFDELVNGLLSGQLSTGDLRREAQSSAAQLRELKRELGSDAGPELDAYLKILDEFLNESAPEPAQP